MIRTLTGCMVVGALLGVPPPISAQERSIGVIYTPNLSLHHEHSLLGCCMAVGPWLSIGRMHIEYVIAWDYHWQRQVRKDIGYSTPEKVDGQILTALWTLRSWRTPRFRTRFQVGGRHGTVTEPIPQAWGVGPGLTVDYLAETVVLRGTFRFLMPKTPDLRIGLGFRF